MFNRMKNKLLITTALVALVSANNAFAQVREDLIVDSQTPISNQGMDEDPRRPLAGPDGEERAARRHTVRVFPRQMA